MAYSNPEPLGKAHDCEAFDCGEPALNDWLKRHALQAQRSHSARVFVTTDGERVVGYYAIASAHVQAEDASERVKKGMPRHPIPVILLARLAVDKDHQDRRIGRSFLMDALLRAEQIADQLGVRAVLVHAKHDRARSWYLKYGFEPSPTDPLHLLLLVKDIRALLSS